ncbi:MAG: ATP-binding protein [Kiritimatiellae bacterium]|nr:ATP-binding protein [Kiritimatiellia bacterium]
MIVGRVEEQKQLGRMWKSSDAEFLALYGRRRVGKTYLVREFFKPKGVFFEAVGQKNAPLRQQLKNFSASLHETFSPDLLLREPRTWREAFGMLTALIRQKLNGKRVLVFLDELPWLGGRRSGLIQALDYEWNKHWSQMPNVKLIVCGSAASWMLNKLVHAKGGLYNRLTGRVHLRPFSLPEAQTFLRSRGIRLKPQQVLELYMVLGGIPFYLRYADRGKSVPQIIDELCFRADAPLRDEFEQLFASLFEHADVHEALIREISRKREGITRQELLAKTGMNSGGSLKRRLDELEASSFIERYVPYGKTRKDYYIKTVDEYSFFYLYWIEPIRAKRPTGRGSHYWEDCSRSPSYLAWRGYAFEAVCAKHVDAIIRGLGLETVASTASGWRSAAKGRMRGAQVDLLIDRTDGAMTLCEMRFSNAPYRMDRSAARELAERMDAFEKATGTRKQLLWALVTPHGLRPGIWADDIIAQTVTLKDIFA